MCTSVGENVGVVRRGMSGRADGESAWTIRREPEGYSEGYQRKGLNMKHTSTGAYCV